ncbi:MAG: hypothetical protein WBP81_04665 [Solirubrobacteraceae bacterium]
MSSGSPTPQRSATSSNKLARKKAQTRLVVAGAAVALIVVFALLNLDKVKVSWIVTTTHTSLTVVIAVSFLLGVLAGVLLWRRRTGS